MNELEKKEGDENQEKTEKQKTKTKENQEQKQEIVKISITKEAESAIIKVMDRVNQDFDGGQISRQDAASWALVYFGKNISETEVRAIRSVYFDEMSMLESILKRAKESGKLPKEISMYLKGQVTDEPSGKKRSKTQLTADGIKDTLSTDAQDQ